MGDDGSGFIKNPLARRPQQAITEGQILVINGPKHLVKTFAGMEIRLAHGKIQRPSMPEIVRLAALQSAIEKDHRRFRQQRIENGRLRGLFPGR